MLEELEIVQVNAVGHGMGRPSLRMFLDHADLIAQT